MREREQELPKGWVQARLEDLVDVLDSQRRPVSATERAKRSGNIPYYGATGQVGWIDKAIFDEELVLLGEDGVQFFDPIKPKSYMVSGPSWVNNHAHALRAIPGITGNRFINHYLNFFDYRGYANGTTRLKLTRKSLNSIPVPIPPLAEQHRIVAALEEQLSRLGSAESTLHDIEARAALVRESALSAELGKVSTRPLPLSDLLAEKIINGRSVQSREGGFPVLRLSAIKNGSIDLSASKEGDWREEDAQPYLVQSGDFLLSRGNGTLSLVGRGGLVPEEVISVAFPDTMVRIRVNPEVMESRYFELLWNSRRVRRQIESAARTTAGIYKVNQSILKGVELLVPNLDDQRAIVARVQGLSGEVSRLQGALTTAQQRSTHLRRSLLSAAFSGKLVPQNPGDEPASVLLERIRAERAAAPKPKRGRRAPAKKAVSSTPAPDPQPVSAGEQTSLEF